MHANERAAAITEVSNLYARLAQAADYGTLEEYSQLLADDVVWDLEELPGGLLPTQIRRGRAEVLEGAEERRVDAIQGPGTETWHVIDNISVVPDETGADGMAYFFTYADVNGTPSIRSAGVYRDRFVRTENGWVLAYRRARRA
jgi:ketosteroid isomerase-like protein